ncbi:hypothetical protein D7W79_11710 [Corallococcus exercitus]|uniref:hypothetical protein n=1 Tax=Corallococcus exercitus TaxID=2316736 RepID=UPI000EA117B1|nr:hypothetical protein [Corallococcus exercitus]RKG78921.1 hypothetical protein D7W79_11710 [Corallococcus exercitus]
MSSSALHSTGQHTLGPVVVKRMELPPPPYTLARGAFFALAWGLAFSGLGVILVMNTFTPLGGSLVALGVVLMAVGGFRLSQHAALRCGFTVYEQGVVISRTDTDSVIPFSEVQSFSLREEEVLFNGMQNGFVRLMNFTWKGDWIEVFQRTQANTRDTFGPVLDQLLQRLADAAKAKIEAGDVLHGQGWMLGSQELIVASHGAMPLRALTHIGTFDRKVSFWREGEELPFFCVANDSPNARQLQLLTQRQLQLRERPQQSEREQPTSGPLGRILFERKPSAGTREIARFLAIIAVLLGVLMSINLAPDPVVVPIMGMLWGAAAGLVYLARVEFRVYELGVTQRKLRERTLRYSELTSFQFATVRTYRTGVYTGTALGMRFTPGPGLRAITHDQITEGNDADLEALREHVAGIVATQLFERFQRGDDIPWGSMARFTQKGLVIRIPRLLHYDGERLLPYGARLRFHIEQGGFFLFVGPETKAALALPCGADNFYPGLKLLETLMSSAEKARAQA